jgi:hypothetical protein
VPVTGARPSMPWYSRVAVLSGSGVPSRDHTISTTMSVSPGGVIWSWKWPEASIGSTSHRIGSIAQKRA